MGLRIENKEDIRSRQSRVKEKERNVVKEGAAKGTDFLLEREFGN